MQPVSYDLDLSWVVHFDLRLVIFDNYHPGNSDDLALEVICGIVNLHFLESYIPGLAHRHRHVSWVVVGAVQQSRTLK